MSRTDDGDWVVSRQAAGWVTLVFLLMGSVVGASVAWGALFNRVSSLESELATVSITRDNITRLTMQVSSIDKRLAELLATTSDTNETVQQMRENIADIRARILSAVPASRKQPT